MKDTTPLIDLVISYVNNQELVWRDTYISFCKKNNMNERVVELLGERFGGIDFININAKLIQKNMPWLNKVYLLVSNIEQAPKNLPSNWVVVLHHNFIYNVFLPTFNSTTIEMFLWNIPNLSEHFIYINDDMLPIAPLKPTDFFDFKTNQIKISWLESENSNNLTVYYSQCANSTHHLASRMGVFVDKSRVFRPVHSFTPMIRSHAKESFNLLKDLIFKRIRAFRTRYQYNQYIYPLYEKYKYGTLDSEIDFLYTELERDFGFEHQIMCVNAERKKEYVDKFLKEIKELCE